MSIIRLIRHGTLVPRAFYPLGGVLESLGRGGKNDSLTDASTSVPSVLRQFDWRTYTTSRSESKWTLLKDQGIDVNPCRSSFHPSCAEGIEPGEGEEVPIQLAYTPESECFGCGPSSKEGLRLRSYRIENGLESIVSFDKKFCAFPGIVNGGIVGTAFDCAGNWTAAIALMDLGCLPNPPLTVVAEMLINYQEPTPPEEELTLRTTVIDINDSGKVGSKATVHVDLSLLRKTPVGEKVLCSGSGIFKKLGALRAL